MERLMILPHSVIAPKLINNTGKMNNSIHYILKKIPNADISDLECG